MEIYKNHRSIREIGWHPRQSREKIEVPAEPTLDPLAKAELETHIIALFPPERMVELFEQEGVNPKDYLSRSFKRKILDFLNF